MRNDLGNKSVLISLAASVALHLSAVVPLLLAVMTSSGTLQPVEAAFSSGAATSEEPNQQPDPKLGIEESRASTFTWVGYDEYHDHLARLAEFEQAAFTDNPIGAYSAESPAVLTTETLEALENLLAIELPAQLPPIELPSFTRILEAVGLQSAEENDGDTTELLAVVVETQPVEMADRIPNTAIPEHVSDGESESQEEEQTDEPETDLDSPGEPGDAADKESDATSTIDVPEANWRLGRPLAAEGVELRPRRPVFSIVQRLTASPCNPLLEMHFDRYGVVTVVQIIESSRDNAIDDAVRASAYRWRAAGEELDSLGESDAFVVRMRFILNPASRCP